MSEYHDELGDDHILRYTQRKRKAFVDQLTESGFPDDEKQQTIMLTALADMDRSALGNKRIGANERLAASDALVAHAITELANHFEGRNPFEAKEAYYTHNQQPNPERLPKITPVPGEVDIGITNETFETLVAKFEDD